MIYRNINTDWLNDIKHNYSEIFDIKTKKFVSNHDILISFDEYIDIDFPHFKHCHLLEEQKTILISLTNWFKVIKDEYSKV